MQDGQNEPGWVFKPGDQSAQAPAPPQSGVPPTPQPEPASSESAPAAALVEQPPVAPAPSHDIPIATDAPHVTWTASEYQANPKSAGWFGALALASVLLAVIVYIVTRDIISTVVIGLVGVIIGVFAARQPSVLQYAVDNQGLHIGEKFYPYGSFKYFSVADDQAISYISLMPLRRFMPPLTIHYDPNDEDRIVDTLAAYLPFEEHKRDVVDSITRRIRF